MKAYTAVIAALPREVSGLVKGWRCEMLPENLVIYSNGRSVVACAGMGAQRAARAVRAVMEMRPAELISAGLAGACDSALRVGDVLRAGVVIDGKTGERFVDPRFDRTLVSTDAIVGVDEKTHLRVAFGAAAVDMEAATVARLARARGLKFRAIKAISDEADFEMKGLSQFVTEDGQFRQRAFTVHACLRPAMWGKVVALGRNSGKALSALTEALRSELD
jgi:adenosylhomocysteine nucleosidase